MSPMLYYKMLVLSLIGMALLAMAWVGELDKDSSGASSHAFTGIFWDGSNMHLADSENSGQSQSAQPIPPRFRPLLFQPVPINDASRDLLMTIPGIGPATAENIVRLREQYGPIRSAEDLLFVQGIGPTKKARLTKEFSY